MNRNIGACFQLQFFFVGTYVLYYSTKVLPIGHNTNLTSRIFENVISHLYGSIETFLFIYALPQWVHSCDLYYEHSKSRVTHTIRVESVRENCVFQQFVDVFLTAGCTRVRRLSDDAGALRRDERFRKNMFA